MNKSVAYILHGAKDLRVGERELGDIGEFDVLLRVGYVGLCGSDLHQYNDAKIGFKVLKEPIVVGHEASATVFQCGNSIQNLKPGDRVAVEPGICCGHCELCKLGSYNLCPSMKFFSSFSIPHTDGILCKYKIYPATLCHKLPDSMSLEEGALIEPLSVAVHACTRAGIHPRRSVCISGAGPVGVLCALVASDMGASEIIITDISSKRLNMVHAIMPECSTLLVEGSDFSLEKSLITILGELPDIFMECSGSSTCFTQAVTHTKHGGTIVCVGIGQPMVNANLNSVITRELNVRGVFRYANCFPLAIKIAEKYNDTIKALISNIFPFEEAEGAYVAALKGDGFKILIKCSDN